MLKAEVIKKADELEDMLISTAGLDEDITLELLDEYSIHVWALKYINDDYPFVKALRIQEICDNVERRSPKVSSETYEQYVVYLKLLAVCLEEIPRKDKV